MGLCVFFFRLLQSKPQAAQKALSENSLLKNIEFNEKFLGEESVTEGEMHLLCLAKKILLVIKHKI